MAKANARSQRTITPGGPLSLRRISAIDVIDANGNLVEDLARMFSLTDRAIVAVDAAKVIAIMRVRSTASIALRVPADAREAYHVGFVEFRIE